MNSYLGIIPISARVHRRQNRMTILCIIFSVFMVTFIFSMAEMGARMEDAHLSAKHGSLDYLALLSSATGQTLLLSAAMLCLFILAAGVLMIAGSLGASVAQRREFFGLMRCIGMSKRQVSHLVTLEALHWCKWAVPTGVVLGTVACWGFCAVLHYLVQEEFAAMPVFGISIIGIASGIIVGLATVLIAAHAPARAAAKTSPLAAVSGNDVPLPRAGKKLGRLHGHIETNLGRGHARASKKNLFMMASAFSLTIILVLIFAVIIDWVNVVMPQSAIASADLTISSEDATNTVPASLKNSLSSLAGIESVAGRRSAPNQTAEMVTTGASMTVDLISFEETDFAALEKDHLLGRDSDLSKLSGDSHYVLATPSKTSPLAIGDHITVDGKDLEVAGILKSDPFASEDGATDNLTLITSDETFVSLTGERDYALVCLQTSKDISEATIGAIESHVGEQFIFEDRRGQSTAGTYIMFRFFVYSFLAVIALVAVFNIINSISMSVSARMREYGMMRAVGMDMHGFFRMILAEAWTYAAWGGAIGILLGLVIHKGLYALLITSHFAYASYVFPLAYLLVIVLYLAAAVLIAAWLPVKRLRSVSAMETIRWE
ncbi:MAG: ABC transporter permease [Peptococcaceae bacterium]|nr:ABC transporter permease [Peptococcaceae bacterium]